MIELALPTKYRRTESSQTGRLPRLTRLMALAIRSDHQIGEGAVRDYAELARLMNVSRARVTQIMNLLLLAPDIQEMMLFLKPVSAPRGSINERAIRAVTKTLDWDAQRELFSNLGW